MDAQRDIVFYDGHCALCHGLIKFLLARDKSGTLFSFAPLQGETFKTQRERMGTPLPDSVVVLSKEGQIYFRSTAVIYLLSQLSGVYRFVATIGGLFPRALRDLGYDFIAKIRKKVFGSKADLCPIIPVELKNRFLL